MFELTKLPIDNFGESQKLIRPDSGGLVFFEGRVRDHNHGKKVKFLEYQCYEFMALKEGEAILKMAHQEFDIHLAKCIHRHGLLHITDLAVWVGVAAAHRKDAFKACQFIINQVKTVLPIWKKEHYQDQKARWVACHERE